MTNRSVVAAQLAANPGTLLASGSSARSVVACDHRLVDLRRLGDPARGRRRALSRGLRAELPWPARGRGPRPHGDRRADVVHRGQDRARVVADTRESS